ncbi:hypothetical protein MSG28_005758 [Choristoneura fumiferana]|uniref:Uncharacterized protein n=1 Tax=Choristoneura fumiferana TaxID=7141 RepID=A0ACC0L0S1_CHOFU|nr:hypothetical protein MSG28_005758 [Choristoneura fumiferana]
MGSESSKCDRCGPSNPGPSDVPHSVLPKKNPRARSVSRTCGSENGRCGAPITGMRNIALEAFVAEHGQNQLSKCENEKCTLRFNVHGMEKHLKECPFGVIDCPMGKFLGKCSSRYIIQGTDVMAGNSDPSCSNVPGAQSESELRVTDMELESPNSLPLGQQTQSSFLENDEEISAANDKFLSAIRDKWQDWNLFFTDASKLNKDEPVGCAFIHDNSRSTYQFQLPPISNIFTGECSAILKVIKYIKEHRIVKSIIFSDSLSAIQALSCNSIKNCAKSAIVCLLKEALLSCHLMNLEVKISWIPSHKGINYFDKGSNITILLQEQ